MATKTVEAQVVLTLGDRLTAGLNRIQARLTRLSSGLGIQRLTSSIGNLGGKIGDLGPAIGASVGRLGALTGVMGASVGGAAFAAFSLANRTAEAAKEIGNMSRLAGIGAEDYQRYAYAADSVGISGEKMADIFKDVQDKVGDFIQTGGGGMKDFFENIAPKVGVTARDFAKLSGPDALQLYVSSLEKANVSQSDMVFYLEAIASDSTLLLPLLKNNGAEMKRLGDEAERTGNVISDAAVAFGGEFLESTKALQGRLEGLVNLMGVHLMPVIKEVADAATGWFDANQDLIRSTISDWVARFAQVLRDLMNPASELRQGMTDLAERVTGFYNAISPLIDRIGGPGIAAIAGLALYITGPLIGAFAALIPAAVKLGAVLLTTPIGWILGGLVLLGASVYVLIQKWDEFVAYWGGMWDRIKAGFEEGFVVGILNALNEFNPIVHIARGLDAVLEYFTGFSLIDAGTKLITDFGNAMESAFVGVLAWAGGIGAAVVQAIVDGIGAAWAGLTSYLNAKISELTGWLPDWVKDGLGITVNGTATVAPVDPPGITSVDGLPVPTWTPQAGTTQSQPDTVETNTVTTSKLVVPEPIITHQPQNVNANQTNHITVNVQGMTEAQGTAMVRNAIAAEQAKHADAVRSALND